MACLCTEKEQDQNELVEANLSQRCGGDTPGMCTCMCMCVHIQNNIILYVLHMHVYMYIYIYIYIYIEMSICTTMICLGFRNVTHISRCACGESLHNH